MTERSLNDTVQEIVERSLAEDIGPGDVTTLATIPGAVEVKGIIVCKQDGFLAGIPVVNEVFAQVDKRVRIRFLLQDGSGIEKGQKIAELSGSARSILVAERTALNFLQRMSGIATLTHHFVQAVSGTKARILDTRKTTPGLRLLEKYAVRCGGGSNHRMGLYDMIMIKDNHIAAAGSITKAVSAVRESRCQLKVEIECKNLDEVTEALNARGVDRIMLDNMSTDTMKQAVDMVAGKVELEASGGVNLGTVRDIALTGVDYISIGALTHSAKALDISLEITEIK